MQTKSKKYVAPKHVRIMANGGNQVEARTGQRVQWTVSRWHATERTPAGTYAGEIIDIHGYDSERGPYYIEALHVRCDDGEIRKPNAGAVIVCLISE